MKKIWIIPLALLLIACQSPRESRERLSLAGSWELRLDSMAIRDEIELPGTTDTNQKGLPNENKEETTHLSRPYRYQGKAWYEKKITIPEHWVGKEIRLTLERTKPTRVWVDSTYVGSSNDISIPQIYDLSPYLSAGTHRLCVQVDNEGGVPPQLLENSHAYTESTQTNWNGIIGDIYLEARPRLHIQRIQVFPHAGSRTADVAIRLHNPNQLSIHLPVQLELEAFNTDKKHRISIEREPEIRQDEIRLTVEMGEEALLWSEFSPALYRLTATIRNGGSSDSQSVAFGLRDFKANGTQFTINGLTTFLRGKHDACVFPLTGHVPMDTTQWRRYFRIAKEYGINHCRFHSWCPPEACFEAADVEGFYLQPELPFWGTLERTDTTLIRFLTKEGLRIQEAYGNHASFVMMAIGNELSGDRAVMTELIDRFREADGRHLYASGSNDYLGYNGPAAGDDYFTTCRIPGDNSLATHTRGSFSFADAEDGGYINHTYPNAAMNFETAIRQCPLPIIGHETGQFQCYPNYAETRKYTGALKPWNLEIFRRRLEKAGMGAQADDFFQASGQWMARLYKAEMEMAFRTPGMAGFQLLDLQDYPGQGTALIGILDAFMDSKGLISAEEWRSACDRVVLLALLPKFCYSGRDTLAAPLRVANYAPTALNGEVLRWALTDSDGLAIAEDSLTLHAAQGSLTEVGSLSIPLPDIRRATTYTLRLALADLPYRKDYPLWIYPRDNAPQIPADIHVIKRWDKQAETLLANGASVLWFPEAKAYSGATVDGLFQTDYWNYRMFKTISERLGKPVSPGTLGLLMDPTHPALAHFPTAFHTDWQWFAMVKESHPLILDALPKDYRPIIQVIDNVERNHKLGLIEEFQVGNGKLLVCMTDLTRQQAYPEARQLYRSLLEYMASDAFNPRFSLTAAQLSELFARPSEGIHIRENISYD